MAVRLSGLVSGMDTDAMVKELVKAKQTEIDNVSKKKTKVEWKKDAWAELNKKIYALYTDQLSAVKMQKSFTSKKVSVTDESRVSISGDVTAINGNQSLQIERLASSAFVTGGKIGKVTADVKTADNSATLKQLGLTPGSDGKVNFTLDDGTNKTTFSFDHTQTIADMKTEFAATGLNLDISSDGQISMTKTDSTNTTEYTLAGDFISLGFTGNTITLKDAGQTETGRALQTITPATYKEFAVKGSTQLGSLGDKIIGSSLTVNFDDPSKRDVDIQITDGMTMNDLVNKLSSAGINARFDEKQQRFFLSSKDSGANQNFSIDFGERSQTLKAALGFAEKDSDLQTNLGIGTSVSTVAGANSKIVYNGTTIEDTSNTIQVNGLVMNLRGTTEVDDVIGISITTDTDVAYKAVKDFVTAYNTLIEEMNKLYYADAAKGYEPLTDEERSAMSDKQAEMWEGKIKNSLFRRDDTVSTILSSMRSQLSGSVVLKDANGKDKSYSLATLGIVTGAYTERGKLHINGDSEDSTVADENPTLKTMLQNEPETVMNVMNGIAGNLYKDLGERMKSIKDTRSAYTFYNDKVMDSQISDYEDKISTMNKKLDELEERYYKQFTAMEKALSKLNSQSSSLASMLGTGGK